MPSPAQQRHFFSVLVIAHNSPDLTWRRLRGSPRQMFRAMRQGAACQGQNGGYNYMGRANKIAHTASQTVDRGKEVMKMVNCDYSYIVTILLILLAVAAGLLMYALCVVSKNADELADNMYNEIVLHTNSKDNHSHWGE